MGDKHDPNEPFFPTITCQSGPNSWSRISIKGGLISKGTFTLVRSSLINDYSPTLKKNASQTANLSWVWWV